MQRIDDATLVAAKEAVGTRLREARLGRWHLRAADRRLETYVYGVARDPAGHNLWEQLAVERFLTMCGRYGLDVEAVKRFIRFYESLSFPGPAGPTHYALTPVQVFQFASIYGFYDSEGLRVVRTAVLYVPRKFSKTTSSAAFVVWDLLMGESNAEAYIGANSADQAKKCFDVVRGCVLALDPEERRFTVNEQLVRCEVPGHPSRAQCLTANARTKDGLNSSLTVMDEYSQARDASLLNVLTTSMGARLEPLTVIITTASERYDGPFYSMLQGYKRLLLGEYEDDTVFAHLFEPDLGDAEDSPATWRKVHPHLGVTVRPEYYRQKWLEAQRSGGELLMAFRTKLLNLYASDARLEWIGRDDIERQMAPTPPMSPGGTIIALGIDLGKCDDLSAIATAFYMPAEGRVHVQTDYFFPEGALSGHADEQMLRAWAAEGHLHLTAGRTVQYRPIADHVLAMTQRGAVKWVGYDAYGAVDMANQLRAYGIREPFLTGVPQSYGYFTDPVFYLEKYIKDGVLTVDPNPITAWMFANCVLVENAQGVKPEKRSSALKIDGVIAMLMAVRGLTRLPR